jgi:hypothetical protein
MKESLENKMSDKFRKALENHLVPYDPRAWERLVKDLPVKPVSRWGKWKFFAGWFLGVLIASFIVYLVF